ncbi:DJ-1/PfpI family protein [Hirsutella rhossiliensis]|uniref:DJ-1/PfpI family domain-containing protein n=1 Tax=Hirsutella rhossiliensis TaxID=111463 RepID=A0A9P8MQG3_9HYPO|nr:DJ-1/PfpI family domain-containing protein [Hirsutella rhossiliensis]KAH0959410.1 DJ-1/PfpI family domain-containing protein [Hirsutella rhossiliensis]
MSVELANLDRTIRVGVILLGGLTEVLDVGPVDLIHGISKPFVDLLPDSLISPEQKAQALDTQFHWVSETGKTQPSRLTSNMSLAATDSFETCPPLDIVLIGASFQPEITEAELAFIRKSYQECSAFITVCAGIEAPLRAGILEGKTATAPRFMLKELRQKATGTQWVERRWARDGKLWTSGTLLNGLDLMTSFIQATWPSGEGSLVDYTMKMCAWPNRDPEYKDVPWHD